MILRIIDKETKVFKRDDFTFDELTEIGLNVEPAQGFIHPKAVLNIELDENGNEFEKWTWVETEEHERPIYETIEIDT